MVAAVWVAPAKIRLTSTVRMVVGRMVVMVAREVIPRVLEGRSVDLAVVAEEAVGQGSVARMGSMVRVAVSLDSVVVAAAPVLPVTGAKAALVALGTLAVEAEAEVGAGQVETLGVAASLAADAVKTR